MGKDALAGVYTNMLNDDAFRTQVAAEPRVLETWDLTDEEKEILNEEANQEVSRFAIGQEGAMNTSAAARSSRPVSPRASAPR